ncbi:MAG TPA: hypothetical protein VK172_00840 [Lentimicrobium sp.]|nr:hypothetical protein [Lentimicrobium sp.]
MTESFLPPKNIMNVGAILVLVLGFLKVQYFYGQFYINISNYIELSEIFTMFLSDAIICAGILFTIYLLVNINKLTAYRDDIDLITLRETKLRNDFGRYNPIADLIIGIAIMVFILLSGYLFLYARHYPWDSWYYLSIMFLFVMSLILTRTNIIRLNPFPNSLVKKLDYSIYISILVLILFFKTNSDVNFIKVGKNELKANFEFSGKTVSTSIDTAYIGQTSNYLFLYVKSKNSTLIFKKDKIDTFTVQIPKGY